MAARRAEKASECPEIPVTKNDMNFRTHFPNICTLGYTYINSALGSYGDGKGLNHRFS
jgi:hypothetical protein